LAGFSVVSFLNDAKMRGLDAKCVKSTHEALGFTLPETGGLYRSHSFHDCFCTVGFFSPAHMVDCGTIGVFVRSVFLMA
jgi:hypothetical protein